MFSLQQHRNLQALHIRLLSLRQPGSCAIKDIFITKSGCHDAPDLGWRENKTVEIVKDLTGCKNATSSSQLHTQDSSASVLLRDGVGTEEPLHPAETPESSTHDDDDKRVTTVPHSPAPAYFSQAEQIRMLLQHALHGPSTQLPSTLDDLRLKMEAGNGDGSTQSNPMSSLVSSIAKMALGANHVTKGPTQPFTKDSTTGHSGSGSCDHPGPLAPAVQLESMDMSIITSLHACLERIERLEEVAQDRVRTLDHMITKVSLLCDKVEVSRRASP
ncbi:hypothetical protein CEUSTIGMA_g2140.t1 [Chlamydomonas eustigma]|uniref:Uncharacterized protein n=1 Tax=Chlamydomonas eustigma TaxID=1157962 RepID=A0A250WVP3_9CHLO|nr:hypothetical protein CEUSTIGMA_g2140.t1 [Chlamydomonas eustigma]|eukprot:GAX74692.1 hypothetical protein CEUSTIGMA_g2140.t1 [Chlamydomonas eustigma]